MSQTSIAEIQPENYRFLQEHVYSQAGIVLEEDKHYLFESRLDADRQATRPRFHQRLVRAAPGHWPGRRSAARSSKP